MSLVPTILNMRWLIIEDSLEGRQGHWFEYLENFCRELPRLGDSVTLLVSRRAEPFILNRLGALPRLPDSAFGKMSDGAPAWRRYARIPVHAWKTFWAVRRHLRTAPEPEIIFVPTVIIHHLLAWAVLVKLRLKRGPTRILLFFPGLPIRRNGETAVVDGSPTSKLVRRLMRWLAPEIRAGKVILGVETQPMKRAAEQAFQVPFTYFPHPVNPLPADLPPLPDSAPVTMACYGPARYEKGSQVLAAAMERHLTALPAGRTRFVLQWLEDFPLASGGTARLPAGLRSHSRVEIVSRFFADGEYAQRLAATQVLLLPYRCSSYALRVSRVVIEALVNGLPVVATRGTTLADQAEQFPPHHIIGDIWSGSEDDTRPAGAAAKGYLAAERRTAAREHFSVRHFRSLLAAATRAEI